MKTEKEIEDAILKITMKIQNQYPELSKTWQKCPLLFQMLKPLK